ncbi:MAG TPA: glycosyl-4,4'-diaponeurosporenoate acyltransferase, partial [Oscillibacter sp.]|nr:glycosyl-4,4'-diaponeurosporenoate acyltransferase [Oscillibacter sp.]
MGFLRCCVYYGILAVVSFFIGRLLPKSWFHGDKFPYRCASWEAKLFRFLRVHEWQD